MNPNENQPVAPVSDNPSPSSAVADDVEATKLDHLHDELHKMIQCSLYGWPDGDNSKAHQLLYKIKRLSSPVSSVERDAQKDLGTKP